MLKPDLQSGVLSNMGIANPLRALGIMREKN
jgi:hypothetical protein